MSHGGFGGELCVGVRCLETGELLVQCGSQVVSDSNPVPPPHLVFKEPAAWEVSQICLPEAERVCNLLIFFTVFPLRFVIAQSYLC